MAKFITKAWDKIKTYTWAFMFKLGYNFNPKLGFPYRSGLWAHAAIFFDDVEELVIYRYGFSNTSQIDLDNTDFVVYKYRDILPEKYSVYQNTPILLATLIHKQYEDGLGVHNFLAGNKIRLYTNSSIVAGELRNRLSTFKGPYACNPYFFHYMGMNSHDQHGIAYNFNHTNGNLFITYLPEG
ncbi:MAG: hypothetical protein EB127_25345 [Alphaproteobacteria bacterium]|nr:hypothetical protein [Alphaproteobacteria bacterium]